jgi:hypothetical protein
MIDADFQLATARQLLARLERLSADSYWAHHASGLRGSLLKCVEEIDTAQGCHQAVDETAWRKLERLNTGGFWILENAAREIRIKENK